MNEPRVFSPPIDVLRNMTVRAAALKPVLCTKDGCDAIATESGSCLPGRWCAEHFAQFSVHRVTPDPTRTLNGLRAAAGIPIDSTFTARTTFDDKAEAKGQRVSAARRAQARGDQQ